MPAICALTRIRRRGPVTRYQGDHGMARPVNDSVDRSFQPVHARFVFGCVLT